METTLSNVMNASSSSSHICAPQRSPVRAHSPAMNAAARGQVSNMEARIWADIG